MTIERSRIRLSLTLLLPLAAITSQLEAQQGAARVSLPAGTRVALVTGSTSGLGRETALRLGEAGYHVIIHGRNQESGAAVVAQIAGGGRGSARFYRADLASLAEVRRFAAEIMRDYQRIDVLVNNAGIWLNGGTRQLSADGHELHFAVNYLAGYLLTRSLLPLLSGNNPGRIINVSSVGQQAIQFDDVMLARSYSDSRGYSQSKLAQIMFTIDLAEELREKRVAVVAVHPATMMNTPMVLSRGAQARSSVEQGVESVMNLITMADIPTGQYFNGLRPSQPNAQANDPDARARLKALSIELTGAR